MCRPPTAKRRRLSGRPGGGAGTERALHAEDTPQPGVAGPRQAGGDVGEDARLRGGGGREREYERGDGRVAGGAAGRCIWCPPSGRRGAGAKWVAERQGNLHGRGEARRAGPDASGCAAPETAPPPDAAEENGLHGAAEPARRSSTSPTDSPVERATGVVRWTRTATFTTGGTARIGPNHGER